MSGTRATMIIKDDPLEPIHFVWFRHNGLLFPQKWYGDKIDTRTGKFSGGMEVGPNCVLGFFKTLPQEQRDMTLEELVSIYPNPEEKGG